MQAAEELGLSDLGRMLQWYGFFLFAAVVWFVLYYAGGYGMYRLAGQNTVKKGWLAWVPIARYWMLGILSVERDDNKKKSTLGWMLLALSTVSCLVSIRDLSRSVAAGGLQELKVGILVRLWAGSPLHVTLQLLLLLGSALAIYRILLVQEWNNAALWSALCIPLWFLRWILLWLAARPVPQHVPGDSRKMQTQQWLQAVIAASEEEKAKKERP